MVITFNEADLVSFGNYLLSDKRKKRFQNSYDERVRQGMTNIPVEDSLSMVHHADVANWIDERSERKLKKRFRHFVRNHWTLSHLKNGRKSKMF